MSAVVEAVSQRGSHRFSKQPRMWIQLLDGPGVEGDARLGTNVQHCSRLARDSTQPNLRQVHLLHRELLAELLLQGFVIGPGDIGDNILTRDIDLLGLPTGTTSPPSPRLNHGFRQCRSQSDHVASDSNWLKGDNCYGHGNQQTGQHTLAAHSGPASFRHTRCLVMLGQFAHQAERHTATAGAHA
jgi:hypothetical protein